IDFFDIEGREVELGTASFIRSRVAGEFARKSAARERAPCHQAELLILQHRHDFMLEFTARKRGIGLKRGKLLKYTPRGNTERFHDLPCGPVGNADIAHFSLPDEIIQRA